MKIKELIEKLQHLDPDLEVVTNGYEGGYKYVDGSFEPFELALNVHTTGYYGPHENADYTYNVPDKSQFEIVKAICL
jgi:hypothetical protein